MRSDGKRFTRPTSRLLAGVVFVFLAGTVASVQAQDATWLLNPGSGDFNTAANWTPATVPAGTATFGSSNTTTLSLSASTTLNTLQFNAGAPAYTFNLSFQSLNLTGTGVANNSSNAPTVNALGLLQFSNTATAGNAIINNTPGATTFIDSSTAGTANITNSATGLLSFTDTSTAGSAVITTNTGSLAQFTTNSTGGNAQFIANAGGTVDFSGTSGPGGSNQITAGSIAGAGNYSLGAEQLTIGGNGLSTTVSGVIADGGSSGGTGASLVKVGNGTLMLSGANTYTGATTVSAGKLLVNGSLAAASAVTVNNTATLGGSGTVGTVTVNSGGTLAPGFSPGIINTGNLAMTSGSTLAIEINGTTVGTQYDQVNVTGTVNPGGATLSVSLGYAPTVGQVFTIINNDGIDVVTGTFAGLAEGSTFTADGREFRISYAGGTGNDVTLTAGPPVVVVIPTLDAHGLFVLAVFLALAGASLIRRRATS